MRDKISLEFPFKSNLLVYICATLKKDKKLMKKTLLTLLIFLGISPAFLRADEGMWLLSLVKQYNIETMRMLGLQLSADDIYSESNPSLKDAIVWFDGGCTGEIVSADGLVLTNHHCGYGAITDHSSVDHDYLTDGFWAASKKDELQNAGMFVSVLVRMENVTDKVLAAVKGLDGQARETAAAKAMKEISTNATTGTQYNADVKEMFRGSEYYLFVFETFKDIRLVGAPPSAIGKFGGDTDNWMWPRHTGDFSIFRIYCGKDNKPAEYSADNVPYHPKKFLKISLKGYNKNDFAMIIGFPGRTNRYLSSYAIDLTLKETYPALVGMWEQKLAIMKKYMDADPKIRIQLAEEYASVANVWKLFKGQIGFGISDEMLSKKQKEEAAFTNWVNGLSNDSLKNTYSKVLPALKKKYDEFHPNNLPTIYGNNLMSLGFAGFASRFTDLYNILTTEPIDAAKKDEVVAKLKNNTVDQFVKYYAPVDQEVMVAYLTAFSKGVPADKQGTFISEITAAYKAVTPEESFKKYAADVFAKSVFVSADKVNAFLAKPSSKTLDKDLGFLFAKKVMAFTAQFPSAMSLGGAVKADNRTYLQGMRLMNNSKPYYPDANSTIRLTYGKIADYNPRDAVHYNWYSTLTGVMQKEDPTNDEFIVPKKLRDLYEKKDFGDYAFNGDIPVAFLSDNDITGGNSGSGVLNGNGDLIGLAFDGNSEAMTGDFEFDPILKRTIAVDIRYVMFVIDKYAGAQRLIDEMTFVK
ncbi:hypothetical protein LBMAG27_16790 [Bacteroidota bacterium]|nr:hypothetical protein LBMAG27_16790 [Bacteroidota bacterium]